MLGFPRGQRGCAQDALDNSFAGSNPAPSTLGHWRSQVAQRAFIGLQVIRDKLMLLEFSPILQGVASRNGGILSLSERNPLVVGSNPT